MNIQDLARRWLNHWHNKSILRQLQVSVGGWGTNPSKNFIFQTSELNFISYRWVCLALEIYTKERE